MKPLLVDVLRACVGALGEDLAGLRDRALLLVGFASAFRRSELVAVDVEDLAFNDHGLVITQRRSKTDQEGKGRRVAIPHGASAETCPVLAVRRWLAAARVLTGPLLRSVTRWGRVGGRLDGRDGL